MSDERVGLVEREQKDLHHLLRDERVNKRCFGTIGAGNDRLVEALHRDSDLRIGVSALRDEGGEENRELQVGENVTTLKTNRQHDLSLINSVSKSSKNFNSSSIVSGFECKSSAAHPSFSTISKFAITVRISVITKSSSTCKIACVGASNSEYIFPTHETAITSLHSSRN